MRVVELAQLTSPEFEKALADYKMIILPVASIEQTGSHCPLGTDLFVAGKVAAELAAKAGGLAAPAIPYGDTLELDFWPGTVNVPPGVLGPYLEAVARSFIRRGEVSIVFLCTHSLNLKSVDLLCRRLHAEGYRVCAIDWWKAVGMAAKGQTTSREPQGHGGEIISSVMLAIAPQLVHLEAAEDEDSLPGLSYAGSHMPGSPFIAYGDFREYCRSGAWGEVSQISDAEKGRLWMDKAIEACSAFLKEWQAR
jgi:creatinine amidohydrolase